MPELPEVETVRKGLEQLVLGKTVDHVIVSWNRIIESPDVEEFKHQLIGETLHSVSRRGKYLIFHWTHFDMVSHLRMEGKFDYCDADDVVTKHTHVRFVFTDQSELHYLDVRKFGRLTLLPKDTAENYKGIKKLGPEPTNEMFKLEDFVAKLKKHKKAIKPLLLDQTLVTGLGNIYVDEALFMARIHPEQPANTLTLAEIEVLHQSIIECLQKAVDAGGTTIRSYKNALGEAGTFQVNLQVYGRNGEQCPNCGNEIAKIKVAQRGTHLCSICQRLHD